MPTRCVDCQIIKRILQTMIYAVFCHRDTGEILVKKYNQKGFIWPNYLKFMYSYEITDNQFSWNLISDEYKPIGRRPFESDIIMQVLSATSV